MAGNFPEIKIVPTRQQYYALPIAEATKKYEGATKLDDKGYMREATYVAGLPYPRPEGKWKANQIMYNYMRRYLGGESYYVIQTGVGITGSHRIDREVIQQLVVVKLSGRVCMEPYGWYDERAKKQSEDRVTAGLYLAPRDQYGQSFAVTNYMPPEKYDLLLAYVPALRRVRLLSSTDVQDAVGGGDNIYLDSEGFNQKLSPTFFPYTCEVVGEREYLVPVVIDGSGYLTSKGFEYRNFEWERRPMYVIKTTSLDKNFVYQHRIIYIDKEMFSIPFVENYDRKGKLYRTSFLMNRFVPEMGINMLGQQMMADHIDQHSTCFNSFIMPATWVTREHMDINYWARSIK